VSLCRTVSLVLVLTAPVPALWPIGTDVPRDESEAIHMLGSGQIDSTQWQELAPFYAEPVRVALGELSLLREVLDGLPGESDLPTDSATLAGYEPWEPQDVQRFFDDYPSLVWLSPVLDFAPAGTLRLGTASLRVQAQASGETGPGSFALNTARIARTRLRVRLAMPDSRVRWNRRSAAVDAGRAGAIQAGNFSVRMEEGLTLGRFGTQSDSAQESEVRQFLQADARTWNGVHWYARPGQRAAIETFVHHRAEQTAAAVYTSMRWNAAVTSSAGMSIAQTRSGQPLPYVHVGLSLGQHRARAAVSTCVPLSGRTVVPVHVECSVRGDSVTAGMRAVYIPSLFDAPMGRVPADIREEVDDSVGWVAHTECFLRADLAPLLRIQPTLSCWWSEYHNSYRAGLSVSGGGRVRYAVRYSYEPGQQWAATSDRHRFSGFGAVDVGRRFTLAMRGRGYVRESAYWSCRASLEAAVRFAGAAEIVPWVGVGASDGSRTGYECGVRHALALHERIRGQLEVGTPLGNGGQEAEVRIRGTVTFEM
jgi:hypothetical protein